MLIVTVSLTPCRPRIVSTVESLILALAVSNGTLSTRVSLTNRLLGQNAPTRAAPATSNATVGFVPTPTLLLKTSVLRTDYHLPRDREICVQLHEVGQPFA